MPDSIDIHFPDAASVLNFIIATFGENFSQQDRLSLEKFIRSYAVCYAGEKIDQLIIQLKKET